MANLTRNIVNNEVIWDNNESALITPSKNVQTLVLKTADCYVDADIKILVDAVQSGDISFNSSISSINWKSSPTFTEEYNSSTNKATMTGVVEVSILNTLKKTAGYIDGGTDNTNITSEGSDVTFTIDAYDGLYNVFEIQELSDENEVLGDNNEALILPS